MVAAGEILEFWFGAPDATGGLPYRPEWFRKDRNFDAGCARFLTAWESAREGAFRDWLDGPRPAAAYLVLTDQIPRNIHRDRPEAYATDHLALAAAREAVARGHDRALPPAMRLFVYLPFEHSEDPADQDRAVSLLEALEAEMPESRAGEWARMHRDVVARFGRFPHRNEILGRASTADELAFLREPGSRF